MIAVGTVGLLVLPGLYTGPRLGVVDALFTATSAVCVTGLIVVDTATYFSRAGQAWIATLIQFGGLGLLTFATVAISTLGRRTSLTTEEAAGGLASVIRHVRPLALVRAVLVWTVVIEAIGATALWLSWRGELGSAGAVWPAVFHAVSAFCNAGFSVFSDSLAGHRSGVAIWIVSALVILGGLGFVVLLDMRARIDGTARRLSTHSRLVLVSTGILLAGGMALYFVFERANALEGMPLAEAVGNAWFMSVTPRTAGFNTVDYGSVTGSSLFLTIVLMVIGGSPGSTAGGLKTTTLAVLWLLLWSRLSGRSRHVSFGGRTIPDGTVQRATSLAVGGLAVLAAGVFLLLLTETSSTAPVNHEGFVRIVFEAHSAFGTVGLSLGETGHLTARGRIIVSALMLVGRLGPLAVASAMVMRVRLGHGPYRYAHEDVAIG